MNADKELHDAIQERIAKENAFFNLLKKAIKDAVDRFDECDTSTSPDVEESVQLSKDRLQEAIGRLRDETVLNKETARGITDWFSQVAQNHLVQDSSHATIPQWFAVATPASPAAPAPATPIVDGTPAPRSFVDRLKGIVGIRTPNQAAWNSLAADPSTLNTNPAFQRVYQAEPVNPYTKGGKRTRKYRRKV